MSRMRGSARIAVLCQEAERSFHIPKWFAEDSVHVIPWHTLIAPHAAEGSLGRKDVMECQQKITKVVCGHPGFFYQLENPIVHFGVARDVIERDRVALQIQGPTIPVAIECPPAPGVAVLWRCLFKRL